MVETGSVNERDSEINRAFDEQDKQIFKLNDLIEKRLR